VPSLEADAWDAYFSDPASPSTARTHLHRVPLTRDPPCAALVEPGTPPRVVAIDVGGQLVFRAELPAWRRACQLGATSPNIAPAIDAALRLEIAPPPAAPAPQKRK
jgi:hypothetical protein